MYALSTCHSDVSLDDGPEAAAERLHPVANLIKLLQA